MPPSASVPHTRWTRVRAAVNWVNLSTPLGLLVARLGGARPVRHDRGTWLADGYRPGFPRAGAFTLGNVVISGKSRDDLLRRPALLRHEDRHCTQYAFCLGPVMLVPYVLAVAVSWVVAADHSSYNPFERLARLDEGGYRSRGPAGGIRDTVRRRT